MTLKTVIFVLVQIQTLIFCKNRWYFCVYWVSKFEVLSSELWKLIVKAMFARLRKLQFFKAVESCTGGYGRFRCQRVNDWGVVANFTTFPSIKGLSQRLLYPALLKTGALLCACCLAILGLHLPVHHIKIQKY